MRKTFYEAIKTKKIELGNEYERMFTLFYTKNVSYDYEYNTIENHISRRFKQLNKNVIGRCISLDDFDKTHGFCFVESPSGFDIDYLVTFAEYSINLVKALFYVDVEAEGIINLEQYAEHVVSAMEAIDYIPIVKDDVVIFVKSNPSAIHIAEKVDEDLSYSILEYDHHSVRGDLQKKKEILSKMAYDIDNEKKNLKGINNSFASDLSQLFNKFIRHNNEDIEFIKNLNDQELETIYDEIYQMWLLAKMQLEYYENKSHIDNVIKNISNK